MAQLLVTATIATSPKQVSSTPRQFRNALVMAQKSLDGAAAGKGNAGKVYLGMSAEANEQPIEMSPTDERVFEAPGDGRWDLSQWYMTVESDGDGLVIIYQ